MKPRTRRALNPAEALNDSGFLRLYGIPTGPENDDDQENYQNGKHNAGTKPFKLLS
jgi:hypothetical protein